MADAIPPVRFAPARGARLAWQEWGSGPTVVAIPPTAQNVEAAWDIPVIRTMFERLGGFCHWVHFDKRGTGASDRRSAQPGIDERVEDLRAVMDDAGIDRAFLYGASEGGPTCLMFAATYPDRVDGLILLGTGPFTIAQDMTPEEQDDWLVRARAHAQTWGTLDSPVVEAFAPSMAGDDEFRQQFLRYERLAASPDSLAEMLEISLYVDVSDVLDRIDAPTLVMHATGDRVVPVEWGRLLARGIENAAMFEYDSEDHFPFTDLSWFDEIERFVTGTVTPKPVPPTSERVEIHTLGRFGVVVDGEPVPNSAWGSRRARQLCKRLVAARGWPLRRDELCDMLWPDEIDMSKLGARLSVQLSAVRRVLGGGVIADRQTVALNLDEVSTDLERLLTAGDDSEIVTNYDGDFLPGDLDDEWTWGIRDEARAAFTSAAHRLLRADGDAGQREAVARKLLAVDRYDDTAHTSLITILHARGRTVDARRAETAYAAAMADLGIEL